MPTKPAKADPGYKTTEFWTTLLIVICATVLCAMGKLDADQWVAASGVVGAGYGLSRGLAKL